MGPHASFVKSAAKSAAKAAKKAARAGGALTRGKIAEVSAKVAGSDASTGTTAVVKPGDMVRLADGSVAKVARSGDACFSCMLGTAAAADRVHQSACAKLEGEFPPLSGSDREKAFKDVWDVLIGLSVLQSDEHGKAGKSTKWMAMEHLVGRLEAIRKQLSSGTAMDYR